MPSRDRAGPGPAVDGDGCVADLGPAGGDDARRGRGERRDAERCRVGRAPGRERPASAPHLLRRAWRHALAVSADASPPARQATSHGHADADRSDRTDERIQEPAPLQCRVRRRLSDGPDAAAPGLERAWHDKGRRCSSRRRRADHGDARLSRAARRARVARVRCPACHSRGRGRRRTLDPAEPARRRDRGARARPAGSRPASCRPSRA